MTRAEAISLLDTHYKELTAFLNDAHTSGVLNDQGKLWIASSLYGILGVLANLRREEDSARILESPINAEGENSNA